MKDAARGVDTSTHPSPQTEIREILDDFYVSTHKGRTYANIHDGDIDEKDAEEAEHKLTQLLLRERIDELKRTYRNTGDNIFHERLDELVSQLKKETVMPSKYRELKYAIRDFINNQETITVNKHHYVRKSGLKRGINRILRGEVNEL